MLTTLVLLLATALALPLSRRAGGFGSVPGRSRRRCLAGGVAIGPSASGLVMLLFPIGLELRPARLWTVRRAVFGLGPGIRGQALRRRHF